MPDQPLTPEFLKAEIAVMLDHIHEDGHFFSCSFCGNTAEGSRANVEHSENCLVGSYSRVCQALIEAQECYDSLSKILDIECATGMLAIRQLAGQAERIASLEAQLSRKTEALTLLSGRTCGSWCTTRDEDGNMRYDNLDDRCSVCIARAALQPVSQKQESKPKGGE